MNTESSRRAIHDWVDSAACLGSGVTFHWDLELPPPTPEQDAPALELCRSCPVQVECLADMESSGEDYPYQVRANRAWWI